MYQALYRKWRPKTFDEVIGQEHITETLKTQVRTGRLSHAYIFIGTRGTGKTTCARILAKAVNCENPVDGNPCNQCRYCRGIDDGSILDIVEMDAASNTGVDNVRELKEEAVFSPAAARMRVYIIDEVHMLSLAAFNALLKIIEEPPPHLMFILATTELQKVPATILSRCQRHSFRRIPTQRLASYLMEIAARESIDLQESAALQIGRLAEGGVRDALSILDQCSGQGVVSVDNVFETMGLAGNRYLIDLFGKILESDVSSVLNLFQKIWMDGKEPATFLNELNTLIRDIMMVRAAPAGAGELISGNYDRASLDSLAKRMTREEILFCADSVQNSLARVRQMRSPRVVAELCLVTLCDSRTAETVVSLRSRISRLEQALSSGGPVFPSAASSESDPPSDFSIAKNGSQTVSMRGSSTGAAGPGLSASEFPGFSVGIEKDSASAGFGNTERARSAVSPASFDFSPTAPVSADDSGHSDSSKSQAPERAPVFSEEKEILDRARLKLPMEIRFAVDDPSKVRLTLNQNELLLEALPGFLLERFRKPEIRSVIQEAAVFVLGREVNLRLSELNAGSSATRDLNELRKFSEVKFIS